MKFLPPTQNISNNIVMLLLYRLGGQQSFTIQEVADIQKEVAGVMMVFDDAGKLILKLQSEEKMAELEKLQDQHLNGEVP